MDYPLQLGKGGRANKFPDHVRIGGFGLKTKRKAPEAEALGKRLQEFLEMNFNINLRFIISPIIS